MKTCSRRVANGKQMDLARRPCQADAIRNGRKRRAAAQKDVVSTKHEEDEQTYFDQADAAS